MNAVMNSEQEQAVAMDAVIEELTPEDMLALEEEAALEKAKRQEILDELGKSLETLKNKAIQGRAEAEKRWLEDLRQYHSAPGIIEGTKDVPGDGQEYRKTNDNITRQKVLLVAARLGDMLFPTNEANWDLTASPSPFMPTDAVATTAEDGSPLSPAQIKAATLEAAKEAAAAMKNEVADNLAESDYSSHGRMAIFQAAQLGTGVLKGPITKMRRVPQWAQDGKRAYAETDTPAVQHVDLWSFYPQPSRNMEECEHVFELEMLPPSKVRRLAKQPGFDPEQVQRLLEMEPTLGALQTGAMADARGVLGRPNRDLFVGGRYPVWKFTGPIPKDAMVAFVTSMALTQRIPPEAVAEIADAMEADDLTQIDAEIYMSQGIVLKAMLRPVRDCDSLGYYVYNYEEEPEDIFGYGVPYLCRDDAIAANQVWHAVMLNTMMSAGPQIGVKKSALEPSQGRKYDLTCTKPRVWALTDEVEDINKALTVFNVPNVVGRMMPVYERIKMNADEHTMMPAVAQGESSAAVPTTGGMAMLMNAANVVMRRLAKQYDDKITMRMIPEFVCWHEQNNPKPELRGDFNTVAKGASHLLIKDIQAQHIQFATQLFTSNPLLQPYMKPGKWARANIDILELNATEMLYTDAEVAEQQAKQGEQPDPEVLKAQALQAQAEAAMKRADAEARGKESDSKFKFHDRALDHQERMVELAVREKTMALQLQAGRFAYLHKLAALDSKERIAMAEIEKNLDIAGADRELNKYQTDFKGNLDAQKLIADERKVATEIAVESPNVKLQ